MLLPTALSAATDAYAACHRLTGVSWISFFLSKSPRSRTDDSLSSFACPFLTQLYEAETMDTTLSTDLSQKEALVIDGAEFEWVGLPEETEEEKIKKEIKEKKKGGRGSPHKDSLDTQEFVASDPFRIRDLSLSIEKGSLVAICGPVGSGSESTRLFSHSFIFLATSVLTLGYLWLYFAESSLLHGLIGEMKRVSGTVTFNGKVAYCPRSSLLFFLPSPSRLKRTDASFLLQRVHGS